jgi:hypothetical protein
VGQLHFFFLPLRTQSPFHSFFLHSFLHPSLPSPIPSFIRPL